MLSAWKSQTDGRNWPYLENMEPEYLYRNRTMYTPSNILKENKEMNNQENQNV